MRSRFVNRPLSERGERSEAGGGAAGAGLRRGAAHAVVAHAVHEAQPGGLVGRLQHLLRQPQEGEGAHHWQLALRQAAACGWPAREDTVSVQAEALHV